ncbi:MAG: alpha/beta hydrolase [Candidatus Altiarchaeota archaeon]
MPDAKPKQRIRDGKAWQTVEGLPEILSVKEERRSTIRKREGEWYKQERGKYGVYDDNVRAWTHATHVSHAKEEFLVYPTQIREKDRTSEERVYSNAIAVDSITTGERYTLYETWFDRTGRGEVSEKDANPDKHIRKWTLRGGPKDMYAGARKRTNFLLNPDDGIIEARSRTSGETRTDFVLGGNLTSDERRFFIGGFTTTIGYWEKQYQMLKDSVQLLTYRIRGHDVTRAGRQMEDPTEYLGNITKKPEAYLKHCANDIGVAIDESNRILRILPVLSKASQESDDIPGEFKFADTRRTNKAKTVEQVDLIGHSMGGMIARKSIVDNPDHVKSLTLVCSPPDRVLLRDVKALSIVSGLPASVPIPTGVKVGAYVGARIVWDMLPKSVGRSIGTSLATAGLWTLKKLATSAAIRNSLNVGYRAQAAIRGTKAMDWEQFDTYIGKFRQTPAYTLQHALKAMASFNPKSFREFAKSLECTTPIMIVAGGRDSIVDPADCENEAKDIGALFVSFTNCDHGLPMEEPELFHDVTEEFIRTGNVTPQDGIEVRDYRK